MMSTCFQWNTTDEEQFNFLRSNWDVRLAKTIIASDEREVGEMGLDGVRKLVGRPGKFTMGITVDWNLVQSDKVDVTVPVILAQRANGDYMPIDGWHRIAKAVLAGSDVVPCVILSREESLACEL